MFYTNLQNENAERITVHNIPFTVQKGNNGAVRKLDDNTVQFPAICDVLFFLGMSTDSDFSSEWWGQNEAM